MMYLPTLFVKPSGSLIITAAVATRWSGIRWIIIRKLDSNHHLWSSLQLIRVVLHTSCYQPYLT